MSQTFDAHPWFGRAAVGIALALITTTAVTATAGTATAGTATAPRTSATTTTALTASALTASASTAGATAAGLPSSTIRVGGWVPAPSQPFDRAAGELCDFPIHGQPIVDEVRKRTLQSNPDGTPKSELYVGRLVTRVTNTDTGAFVDADASGNAVITYGADGSQTWYVVGPTLIGFRTGTGNLPRGLYTLDGVYTLAFAPDGYKTFTPVRHATHDNLCEHLD